MNFLKDLHLQFYLALMPKGKLNLILKSKSTIKAAERIGDVVQIFIKLQHGKRGKWSSAKLFLPVEKQSGAVTVPVKNSRTFKAAVEYVRFAVTQNEFP